MLSLPSRSDAGRSECAQAGGHRPGNHGTRDQPTNPSTHVEETSACSRGQERVVDLTLDPL
jgi:hypothetical protein